MKIFQGFESSLLLYIYFSSPHSYVVLRGHQEIRTLHFADVVLVLIELMAQGACL